MDYVRMRIHVLLKETCSAPTTAEGKHTQRPPNRLDTVLRKILVAVVKGVHH